MTVAVLAVAIQAAIGIPLGLIAGYVGGDGGWPHCAGRRRQLGASLGGETLGALAVPFLVLVIGLAEWPYFTRTVGAAALVEAAKDHIRAVRALGASDAAIVRQHILPNILSPLIVVATTQVAGSIMAEAALSFLGLGLPVTQPSLGTLIRSGYDLIFAGVWWVTLLPGLTLVSMLVAVNVLADTLRDALDPHLTPR